MQEIILVTENWKGEENNLLLTFEDYMGKILAATCESREELSLAVLELENTRKEKSGWAETYCWANKTYGARYCADDTQLLAFLNGTFNNDLGRTRFDTERCSKECLDFIESMGLHALGQKVSEQEQAYDIEIKEVLSRIESVRAESLEEALKIVMERYQTQEIVLGADDFVDVEIQSCEDIRKTTKNLHSR